MALFRSSILLTLWVTLFFNSGVRCQENPSQKRPSVALALGGGGTRGMANVGVLRVLRKEGIPIDYIAGTSMGAIIGGLHASGLTVDEVEDRLVRKSLLRAFYTVPLPVRVAAIPIFFVPHVFGYHPYDGLYRGRKFAQYLRNSVPESMRKIENLRIPFCAVAANLLDGKSYAISTGDLGTALQASSAIPGLRRPVPIEDKLFIDGGILANVPVKEARKMGADIVVAVDVDETFNPPSSKKDFRRIFSVGNRVANMLLYKVDESEIAAADIVIQPNVNGINILSKKVEDVERAMHEGERAAQEAVPLIKARLMMYSGDSDKNRGNQLSPEPGKLGAGVLKPRRDDLGDGKQ